MAELSWSPADVPPAPPVSAEAVPVAALAVMLGGVCVVRLGP